MVHVVSQKSQSQRALIVAKLENFAHCDNLLYDVFDQNQTHFCSSKWRKMLHEARFLSRLK